ncbi:universal stress protein [Actinophytocola sp.]|uniref:universal stress protein n=1 Tax=Actinophytocola sp. TaxID=1872138 RepID=UPI00389A4566
MYQPWWPALIAAGSRGRSAFTGPVLGSVSQTVLHHATCPIAAVRTRMNKLPAATAGALQDLFFGAGA